MLLDVDLGTVGKIAQYAGPVALAAFAGVLLGGIALSFFWKGFGPWKMLEASKKELENCQAQHERDAEIRQQLTSSLSDLQARYNMLLQAVQAAGLGLQLGRVQVNLPGMIDVQVVKDQNTPTK